MACQLINNDTDKKITLPSGNYVLGRGKLFGVYDARVSRKHGQLKVTDDSLIVTALHENPCFYKKGGTMEVQVLKQHSSVSLNTGDMLGLLPTTHWYVVLHVAPLKVQDNEVQNKAQEKNEETSISSDIETDDEAESRLIGAGCVSGDVNKEVTSENNNLELESTQSYSETCTQVSSQSELHKEENPKDDHFCKENSVPDNVHLSSTSQSNCDSTTSKNENMNESNIDEPGSPSLLTNQQEDASTNEPGQSSESSSPLKRPLEVDEADKSDEAKKPKSDTEEKPDVKPNVNRDQAGSSNSNDDAKPNALPQAPLRERCMYGANCYRRNPLHLAQYSHPRDADWGAGARAPCPWGAACAKRDARHWRDHEHPAGPQQPPPPNRQRDSRVLYRQGNVYYINAHTVKVYDNRIVAEDSDGNPVDSDTDRSEHSADSDYDF
ncbi:aprataxin and PNK-like factor isoform X2 [Epargyreus clarus]|uniref:aprataxin and PNK-like factor isoform X2 n=1 Tax=Epargyreus clarus TaxID=520877 RepID=UPI003C2B8A5D